MLAEGNARSLPLSGALERSFTQVSSCLTHKHYTRLERVAKDKYSSLFVRYRRRCCEYGATTLSIKGLFATFSIMILSITTLCNYAQCRVFYCSAECRYAECRSAVNTAHGTSVTKGKRFKTSTLGLNRRRRRRNQSTATKKSTVTS
jgi:hypothetical protein